MSPFLQEQHRPARTGAFLADERDLRRVDQRRVFGSVDEAGEVTIMTVRPARCLFRDRGHPREFGDRLA
jgi:hypothetical protein